MNWTGGGLQRHSSTNRKGTAAQLQREHFARVQQNLRNGGLVNKNSPVKFSVFGIDVRDRERLDQKLSSPHQGYDLNRDNGSKRSRVGLVPRPHLPPPVSNAKYVPRLREHEFRRPQRSIPIKRDPSQAPDDDLYNATPPPRPVKRKRDMSVSESDMASVSQGREGRESVSEIKRRLLRRGDWVGITIQKPLQLTFGPSKDGNDIARRRNVTDGHQAQYRSAQSHIDSPFLARNRPIQDYRGGQQIQRIQPSAPDVRISIGGRTVPPGVSSSIGQGRRPSTAGRRSSRAVSSEILLLDNQIPRVSHGSDFARDRSESSLLLGTTSRAASHHHLEAASESSHALLALSGEQSLSQDDLDDEDQGWAGVTADSLAMLQQNFQKPPNLGEQLPRRSHKKSTPAVDNHRSLRSGQEIFSSSSTSIHHPRPQTSRRSVLLQEGSSQVTESNIAQLGKETPTVSSSQLLQNEIWRAWAAPHSDGEEDDDRLPEYSRGGEGVSSGMSMSPPARVPSRSVLDDEYSLELEEPYSPDLLHVEPNDTLEELSDDDASIDLEGWGGRGEDEEDSMEILNAVTNSQDSGTFDEKVNSSKGEENLVDCSNAATNSQNSSLPTEGLPLDLPPLEIQVTPPPEEDLNEVWRKFVFGSSDEPKSPDAGAAERTNAPGRGPGQSSIIAHPSSGQEAGGDFRSRSSAQPTPSNASNLTYQGFGSPELQSMAQPSPIHSSPTRDGRTSMHASNGSSSSSSSELTPTTRAVHGRSPSFISQPSNMDSIIPQKKVVFTKPKPFVGRKSNLEAPLDEEPLYIGRGLRGNDGQSTTESKRKRSKNVSNFADADVQDELESIEDD